MRTTLTWPVTLLVIAAFLMPNLVYSQIGKPILKGPNKTCQKSQDTFQVANPKQGIQYTWQCAKAATCSGNDTFTRVSYQSRGTGLVIVTASDGQGNSKKDTASVNIRKSPRRRFITGVPSKICPEKSSFPVRVANPTSCNNYTWNCSGGVRCNLKRNSSNIVMVTAAGNGRICVKDSNDCGSSRFLKTSGL